MRIAESQIILDREGLGKNLVILDKLSFIYLFFYTSYVLNPSQYFRYLIFSLSKEKKTYIIYSTVKE